MAEVAAPARPAEPPVDVGDARAELANLFLHGDGLEIGALHLPIALPPDAHARYVDRMSVDELRVHYPELASLDLTPVDVIDDGERLESVDDESVDFIVANHFLEHCQDPIRTIQTHLSKLRPGGTLFYAVPDKRYTFDFRRPRTPLQHLIDDHEQGPDRSRADHYLEFAQLVYDGEPRSDEQARAIADQFERDDYSIHFHVWTQADLAELVFHLQERLGNFRVEAIRRRSIENIVVLRKDGGQISMQATEQPSAWAAPVAEVPAPTGAATPMPAIGNARAELAERFLHGQGLEIGALHLPIALPPGATARNVDRMSVDALRAAYPELANLNLSRVDVIDDGERLETIEDESVDFIVANHFLEHCQDPIRTIQTHLSKLRLGGTLFYAVPDKRYTFDYQRPRTQLQHVIDDHEHGPERSRSEHYRSWVSAGLVPGFRPGTEQDITDKAAELDADDYSIHFHVWTQADLTELMFHVQERSGNFDVEATRRNGIENIVVLRKHGDPPAGAGLNGSTPGSARTAAGPAQQFRARSERALRNALDSAPPQIARSLRYAKRRLKR